MATYFVGDLCYVLTDDEWQTVCAYDEFIPDTDGEFDPEGYLDPEAFSFEDEDAGRPFFILKTAYGDGCYIGNDGREYSVDSGTIGVIKVDYISDKAKLQNALSKQLGHLHEWDDFTSGSLGYDGDTLYFHDLDIPTG